MEYDMEKLNVIILAGGKGTRIKAVLGETPKIMGLIEGIPFIEYLERWVESSLAYVDKRVIIATGVGHQYIDNYHKINGKSWLIVKEEKPLGTLGAASNCIKKINGGENDCLVINGDTLFEGNLKEAYSMYKENREVPLLVVRKAERNDRYGGYSVEKGYIKVKEGITDYISMGAVFTKGQALVDCDKQAMNKVIRMMDDDFVKAQVSRAFILEKDSDFIDIGVPESFKVAQSFIPQNFN